MFYNLGKQILRYRDECILVYYLTANKADIYLRIQQTTAGVAGINADFVSSPLGALVYLDIAVNI